MAVFLDKDGTQQEITLKPTIYKEALNAGLSVPQLINRKYPTCSETSSTFDQLCVSSGLIVGKDREFGLRSPTISDMLDGKSEFSGSSNVLDADPASRILYPAVVLEMVEDTLQKNRDLDVNVFEQMIGLDTSITSNRFEWPVVSLKRAEAARARAIAQLAEPQLMLSITAADTSRSLLTTSIGMEVSDQALQSTTLDFVNMALTRQLQVERNAKTYEYLLAFLNGDPDMGQDALVQVKAKDFDDTITSDGVITKKALVAWLVSDYYVRQIDWLVTDLDVAMAIEDALATTNTNQHVPGALVPQFSIVNRMLSNLKMFIVEPGKGWPANTIMGFMSSQAIHRVRNTAAAYSAVEQFVMRRSTQLRIDSAEIAYRQFDDAFSVLSLTV